MQKLIPIKNDGERQTVLGRDLHEFLEVETPYHIWFPRMIEYGFSENVDFIGFEQKCTKPQGGRPTADHQLTIDMAKEIAMIQRTDKGKQARQYFIEVEKAYREQNNPFLHSSKELQAIFLLDHRTQEQDKRLTKLENTMTIDYSQQETLREIANKTVLTILGGKSSMAYKLIGPKTFAELWRHVKRTLNVNSYRNIAVVDYDRAKEVVLTWKPDKELALMITGANVQGGGIKHIAASNTNAYLEVPFDALDD